MIQRPASGTFDLELCKPTHTGEKSFAVTAPEFSQHLQIPFAGIPLPWSAKPVRKHAGEGRQRLGLLCGGQPARVDRASITVFALATGGHRIDRPTPLHEAWP
jgi:hypothetical protein